MVIYKIKWTNIT